VPLDDAFESAHGTEDLAGCLKHLLADLRHVQPPGGPLDQPYPAARFEGPHVLTHHALRKPEITSGRRE
jgi:hypothetical protein